MGQTIVDFPKITQMLDAGWMVWIRRGGLGCYVTMATHTDKSLVVAANARLRNACPVEARGLLENTLENDRIDTDDFTPEQALTRLAYKVLGEII